MILTFSHKHQETDDIWSFSFTPEQPVSWIPGQALKLEINDQYGPTERHFTISSAPFEKHITITTRITDSPYKQTLAKLQAGDKARGFNIEGEFIWRESDKPLLLLADGIGITPYRSMLAQRIHDGKPVNATLIYGSTSTELAFRSQLDTWAGDHPEFKPTYLIGQRLHAEFISQHAPDMTKRLVFLSGPTAMVDELSESLVKHGIAQSNLVREWLTGQVQG